MAGKSILITKEIENRLQESKFRRSQQSKLNKKAKRRLEAIRSSGHREKSRFILKEKLPGLKKGTAYEDIQIPNVLDLTKPGDETLELIRDIRRLVRQKASLRLVFKGVKDIQPASLLLLLAEIHRCRLIYGPSKLTGTYPEKGSSLEKTLHATGFFKLLGVKSRLKNVSKRYPVDYVEFISDTKPPEDLCKNFRKALFGEDIPLNVGMRRHLTRAITEAVVNVGQHAYPIDTFNDYTIKGRWWLSGHVNVRSKQLTMMFCDLGVGIPGTLPKRYPMEIILSVLSLLPGIKPNDGEMIKAGMEIGRTQTMRINRGKGLNDLRRIIDESGEGELHIFSRRGCYRYSPGKVDEVRNFDMSVGGTLIKWTIPLSKFTDWVEENEDGSSKDN